MCFFRFWVTFPKMIIKDVVAKRAALCQSGSLMVQLIHPFATWIAERTWKKCDLDKSFWRSMGETVDASFDQGNTCSQIRLRCGRVRFLKHLISIHMHNRFFFMYINRLISKLYPAYIHAICYTLQVYLLLYCCVWKNGVSQG